MKVCHNLKVLLYTVKCHSDALIFPFKTKKINCTHFLEYVGRLYSIESDNLMRKRFVRDRILAMIVIITKMASVELVSIIYTKYAIIISLSIVYSASITSIS